MFCIRFGKDGAEKVREVFFYKIHYPKKEGRIFDEILKYEYKVVKYDKS